MCFVLALYRRKENTPSLPLSGRKRVNYTVSYIALQQSGWLACFPFTQIAFSGNTRENGVMQIMVLSEEKVLFLRYHAAIFLIHKQTFVGL